MYSAIDPFKNPAAGLVSTDGQTAFTPVLLNISNGQVTEDLAQRIFGASTPAEKQGIEIAAGGTIGSALSSSPTEKSEVVGLVAAMIILAITFGSVVAMGLPILAAILGPSGALGGIGLLSHAFTISVMGPTPATMIGLGVGIDYSLFLVTRYRAQIDARRGASRCDRALGRDGRQRDRVRQNNRRDRTGLAVGRIPLVSALGVAPAVALVTALAAAITLLPAILSLLGSHVFAGRLPRPRRRKRQADRTRPGVWERWADAVTRHPWICVAVALAILVPLGRPRLLSAPRAGGHRRLAWGYHRAAGIRPDVEGLRPRLQRPSAGGGAALPAPAAPTSRSP